MEILCKYKQLEIINKKKTIKCIFLSIMKPFYLLFVYNFANKFIYASIKDHKTGYKP